MTQVKGLARLVAAIGLIVLTGCTHGGNVFTSADNTAEASRLAAQPGTTFNQNLAYEYAAFARNQQQEADYTSADIFAKKSMAAARGGAVAPEEIARWRIPSAEQGGFTSERGRLVTMLATDAPQRVPSAAARSMSATSPPMPARTRVLSITRIRRIFTPPFACITGSNQPSPAA